MTTSTETISVERCCGCGISFGMPESLVAQRRRDGKPFYCPNGCGQSYQNSEAKQIKELKSERDYWEKEAQRLLEECDKLRAKLAPPRSLAQKWGWRQ